MCRVMLLLVQAPHTVLIVPQTSALVAMPIVNASHKQADSKAASSYAAVVPGSGGASGSGYGSGGGDRKAAKGSVLKTDERFPLSGVKSIAVGLGWDLARKGSVDLDASCVLFDNAGQFVTSVYFGNLSTASCAAMQNRVCVVHSGDNRNGAGEGDDETIACALDLIPTNVRALFFCVTSYQGDPLFAVQSASLRILDTSKAASGALPQEIGSFQLADAGGASTALLMAKLYRAAEGSNDWVLHCVGQPAEGRSFGDLLPLMQQQLKDVMPNVVVNPKPNVLVLAKGENVTLNSSLKRVMCGLGWDQMGQTPIDLDASCLLFDNKQQLVDTVFFNRLSNGNASVRHGGDNLTGEGEGDDEKIFIDLDKVPENVESLFVTVTSYTGQPFSWIKNAFVRVVDTQNNAELIRFQLNGTGSPNDTALLMVKITRVPELPSAKPASGMPPGGLGMDLKAPAASSSSSSRWMLKALGHGTVGRMYKDVLKPCQDELRNELKIAANTGFQYTPLAVAGGQSGAAAPAAPSNRCCTIL